MQAGSRGFVSEMTWAGMCTCMEGMGDGFGLDLGGRFTFRFRFGDLDMTLGVAYGLGLYTTLQY